MTQRSGFFSSESIERVRMSSDIANIVGRHMNLKPAGRNLKGLCPFHREKTPSFFVSPERQTYHCFGCGAGGDVFSFLMSYLSYTFREAVEELAAEAGIEIETSARDTSRTDVFREILSLSHGFFREQFKGSAGKAARAYIDGRHLSGDTIDSLGIGWAPGGSRLTRYLRDRGYSESQLVEAGICVRPSDGSVYDRFRDRILFPIRDRRGRTISFGGRLMVSRKDVPKYINGPDSPVYRKGDILYGYNQAPRAARDMDMLILVEGYFDHARILEAGFACVVATCGTALTSSQARQLGAVSSDIFICYDGDSAGRKAAVKAAEVILEQGHLPRIMRIPDNMDPDDYILERGADGVLELAAEAQDPIKFALGLLGDWSMITGSAKKVKVVRRLASIASAATDPVILETLLTVLSQETGYSMQTLQMQVDEEDGKRSRHSSGIPRQMEPNRWDSTLLAAILISPEGLDDSLLDLIEEIDIRSDAGVRIYREIVRQSEDGIRQFQLSLLDNGDAALCSRIMSMFPDGVDADGRISIENAVVRRRLERELSRLKSEMLAAGGEERVLLNRQISEIGKKLIRM